MRHDRALRHAPEAPPLTPTQRVRRARFPLVVICGVLLVAVLLAWSQRGSRGSLDPDAYDDAGSRAVAALLEDRGVDVERVTSAVDAAAAISSGPPSTLLIAVPDLLQEDLANTLAAAKPATIVLIAPTGEPALDVLAGGAALLDLADDEVREPGCPWEPAARAGSAQTGGFAYRAGDAPAQSCYPSKAGATVTHQPSATNATVPWSVTVVGDSRPFQNQYLAREGNAALAINLLSEHDRVVWYLPSIAELDSGEKSFSDLAPAWFPFVAIQGFLVVLVVAAWRTRRFGPVLVEPLPVRVPSTETVEGRGRLYRRTRSRDRAARELRSGTLARIRRPCGLTAASLPTDIVDAVAARSTRTREEISALLFGGMPSDDRDLISLADQLLQLEKEIL